MNFMTCSKERILLRRALIYIYCAIKSVVIGTYYVYVYHLNHLGGLENKDSLYTIVTLSFVFTFTEFLVPC